MGMVRVPGRQNVHALQMPEKLDQPFGLAGCVMDFHPRLDPGGGEDNVLRAANGFCDPVASLLQELADLDALGGAGMIVAVIRENHDFKLPPFARAIGGAQFVKPFIDCAEHGQDIAGQVLGIVRRTQKA